MCIYGNATYVLSVYFNLSYKVKYTLFTHTHYWLWSNKPAVQLAYKLRQVKGWWFPCAQMHVLECNTFLLHVDYIVYKNYASVTVVEQHFDHISFQSTCVLVSFHKYQHILHCVCIDNTNKYTLNSVTPRPWQPKRTWH